MIYKAVSDNVKPIRNRKPPQYATRCSIRSPEVKYQQKHHAVMSLRNKITYNPDSKNVYRTKYDIGRITVYKLNDAGEYEAIFSHDSELADAFRAGYFTPDQLIARIEW